MQINQLGEKCSRFILLLLLLSALNFDLLLELLIWSTYFDVYLSFSGISVHTAVNAEHFRFMSFVYFLQGSIHVSLTSSSKMAAISSVLLAAAASEEEESAESILERHMSLVFSGPDTETSELPCHSAHRRGLRTASGIHCPSNSARHAKSSSLTHSHSAAEGNWSSSDHWSLPDKYQPAFRTSVSFGDGDLPRSKLCQPNLSEGAGPNHERMTTHVRSNSATSKHHQHRHLLPCPHTNSERK